MIRSPFPCPWPGGHIPDGCESRLDRSEYRDGLFVGETSHGFRGDEDAMRAAEAEVGRPLAWTTSVNQGGLVFLDAGPVTIGHVMVCYQIADPWNGDPH